MAVRSVLFVCTHNAGRSQMAAGYLTHLSGGAVEVSSAGTAPADALNPAVVAAMLEEAIDLRDEEPQAVSVEALHEADLLISLGADLRGLGAELSYSEWDLPESTGLRLEAIRPIRDAIKARVLALLRELNASVAA